MELLYGRICEEMFVNDIEGKVLMQFQCVYYASRKDRYIIQAFYYHALYRHQNIQIFQISRMNYSVFKL